MRVEEKSANFAGALKIGGQRQRLVTECAAELGTPLCQRRDQIAVERRFEPTAPNTWQVPTIWRLATFSSMKM